MSFYLTPAAIGFLTRLIKAAMISLKWYVRCPGQPRHTWSLAEFFLLFPGVLFPKTCRLPPPRLSVVFIENTLFALALIFLLQFACCFPPLHIRLRHENRDAQLERGAPCT